VVEHLRKETPSRWVGVIGLIPSVIVAGYTVAAMFAWFGLHASAVSGFTVGVYSLFTPLGSLLGVTIVQGKVTSPETVAAELRATAITVAAAQAAGPDQAR
jgi:hypothetical protein